MRFVSLLVFLATGLTLLSGCGGNGDQPATSNDSHTSSGKDHNNVRSSDSDSEKIIARLREGAIETNQELKDNPPRYGIKELEAKISAHELSLAAEAVGKKADLEKIEFRLGDSDTDPVATMMAPKGAEIDQSLSTTSIKLGKTFHIDLDWINEGYEDKRGEMLEAAWFSVLTDSPDTLFVRWVILGKSSFYNFVKKVQFGPSDLLASSSYASILGDEQPDLEDTLLMLYCVNTLKPKEAIPNEPLTALKQLSWSLSKNEQGYWVRSPYPCCASDRTMPLLAKVPDIKSLSLSGFFTDEGLSHIAHQTKIESLELNMQYCTEAGYKHLREMTELRSLTLEGLRCTSAVFEHFAEMTKLERLKMGEFLVNFHPLSGDGLKHFEKLTALESLDLNGHRFNDDDIAHLPALPALETLELRSNPIRGATLHRLELPSLTELNLNGCRVKDLSAMKQFPKLRRLEMIKARARDDDLAGLVPLKNLQFLDIRSTPISDRGAVHLSKITSLTELHMSETSIHEDGFALLCKLPKLRELEVSDSPLNDKVFEHLAKAPQIKSVTLYKTRITREAAKAFKAAHPNVDLRTDVLRD